MICLKVRLDKASEFSFFPHNHKLTAIHVCLKTKKEHANRCVEHSFGAYSKCCWWPHSELTTTGRGDNGNSQVGSASFHSSFKAKQCSGWTKQWAPDVGGVDSSSGEIYDPTMFSSSNLGSKFRFHNGTTYKKEVIIIQDNWINKFDPIRQGFPTASPVYREESVASDQGYSINKGGGENHPNYWLCLWRGAPVVAHVPEVGHPLPLQLSTTLWKGREGKLESSALFSQLYLYFPHEPISSCPQDNDDGAVGKGGGWYIQYKVAVPDLTEFTLCTWSKFYNHSNDHPLFSYAVPSQARAIYSWVSNTARSSYFSLSVSGHTFYRLNYPLRLNRWYHSCQSWNGRTGEWQAWVNGERIGRGFHNRLVGYVIPGGGIPITGQEQRQFGGGFLEGPGAPTGSGGMLGEITLLHLYSAALYPGKAHKDHKHHHGHHHAVTPANSVPPSATTPAPSPFPPNPFLLVPNGMLTNAVVPQFPQLVPTLSPSLLAAAQLFQQHKLFKRNEKESSTNQKTTTAEPKFHDLLDDQGDEHILIKRSNNMTTLELTKRPTRVVTPAPSQKSSTKKRSNNMDETKLSDEKGALEKEMVSLGSDEDSKKTQTKRGILLGLAGTPYLTDDYLGGIRLLGGDFNQQVLQSPEVPEQENKDYPREPAEDEVKQVMNICSGCSPEPFKKVEVISWRVTPKKLYSGALFVPAHQECRRF
uniref:Pentraxin (PTX) domain-containing protein n=1 Tax=Timema poppense TaxID=170557 RepID=A0A7R9D6R1_TIMPO|nr:unnamed protein product [Timema poppensis]